MGRAAQALQKWSHLGRCVHVELGGVFIIGEMSRERPHSERESPPQSSELKAMHSVLN